MLKTAFASHGWMLTKLEEAAILETDIHIHFELPFGTDAIAILS